MTTINAINEEKFYMRFSVGPQKDTPREHYTKDSYGINTMKRNVVAFSGKCVVVAEADLFFGGEYSKPYRSAVLKNPTWGRLFQCAKAAQKKTLDLHHAFFEGVYVQSGPKAIVNGEEVTVLCLSLGS